MIVTYTEHLMQMVTDFDRELAIYADRETPYEAISDILKCTAVIKARLLYLRNLNDNGGD